MPQMPYARLEDLAAIGPNITCLTIWPVKSFLGPIPTFLSPLIVQIELMPGLLWSAIRVLGINGNVVQNIM
jgi:hypothetical protein